MFCLSNCLLLMIASQKTYWPIKRAFWYLTAYHGLLKIAPKMERCQFNNTGWVGLILWKVSPFFRPNFNPVLCSTVSFKQLERAKIFRALAQQNLAFGLRIHLAFYIKLFLCNFLVSDIVEHVLKIGRGLLAYVVQAQH